MRFSILGIKLHYFRGFASVLFGEARVDRFPDTREEESNKDGKADDDHFYDLDPDDEGGDSPEKLDPLELLRNIRSG